MHTFIPSQVEGFPLVYVEFHLMIVDHISNLSTSFGILALPCRVSVAPPSLVSSANLLNMHSILSFRSLIKMLNNIRPRTDKRWVRFSSPRKSSLDQPKFQRHWRSPLFKLCICVLLLFEIPYTIIPVFLILRHCYSDMVVSCTHTRQM